MIQCADCGCHYPVENERPENHSPVCPIRALRWQKDMPNPEIKVQYRHPERFDT